MILTPTIAKLFAAIGLTLMVAGCGFWGHSSGDLWKAAAIGQQQREQTPDE